MIEEQPYNADDGKKVNAARKKASRERILEDEVIRVLMSSPEGRRWIWSIFQFADIWGNPHVPGMPDSTAFNVGMANLAKMIWMRIKQVVPESAMLMLKESEEKNAQE